jgi:hypothetical protein
VNSKSSDGWSRLRNEFEAKAVRVGAQGICKRGHLAQVAENPDERRARADQLHHSVIELLFKLGRRIACLYQPPLHLGLSDVPITRVDGLELAAVNRKRSLRRTAQGGTEL